MPESDGDLGFRYIQTKSGEIGISHYNRLVTQLRGVSALKFAEKISSQNFRDQQQTMARVTGQYKRGNERQGKHKR